MEYGWKRDSEFSRALALAIERTVAILSQTMRRAGFISCFVFVLLIVSVDANSASPEPFFEGLGLTREKSPQTLPKRKNTLTNSRAHMPAHVDQHAREQGDALIGCSILEQRDLVVGTTCIIVVRRLRQQLTSPHFQLQQIDRFYLFADVLPLCHRRGLNEQAHSTTLARDLATVRNFTEACYALSIG